MQVFDATFGKWSVGPSHNPACHGTNCCVYDIRLRIAAGSGARDGEPELTSIENLKLY